MLPAKRRRVLAMMLGVALSACVSAHGDAAGRIIVKFKSDAVRASDPALISEMNKQARAQLVYERAMSGGAHVYIVKGPHSESDLAAIAERIAQRTEVEYAEPDQAVSRRGASEN